MPIEPIRDISKTPISRMIVRIDQAQSLQLEVKGLQARALEQPQRMRQQPEPDQVSIQGLQSDEKTRMITDAQTVQAAPQQNPAAPQPIQPTRGAINLTV